MSLIYFFKKEFAICHLMDHQIDSTTQKEGKTHVFPAPEARNLFPRFELDV